MHKEAACTIQTKIEMTKCTATKREETMNLFKRKRRFRMVQRGVEENVDTFERMKFEIIWRSCPRRMKRIRWIRMFMWTLGVTGQEDGAGCEDLETELNVTVWSS